MTEKIEPACLPMFAEPPVMMQGRARDPHWPEVRKLKLKATPHCECCGRSGHLQVHHIKPYHLFPDLELKLDNLLTVCPGCHLVLCHLGDWSLYEPEIATLAIQHRARVDLAITQETRRVMASSMASTKASEPAAEQYRTETALVQYVLQNGTVEGIEHLTQILYVIDLLSRQYNGGPVTSLKYVFSQENFRPRPLLQAPALLRVVGALVAQNAPGRWDQNAALDPAFLLAIQDKHTDLPLRREQLAVVQTVIGQPREQLAQAIGSSKPIYEAVHFGPVVTELDMSSEDGTRRLLGNTLGDILDLVGTEKKQEEKTARDPNRAEIVKFIAAEATKIGMIPNKKVGVRHKRVTYICRWEFAGYTELSRTPDVPPAAELVATVERRFPRVAGQVRHWAGACPDEDGESMYATKCSVLFDLGPADC